jgi:hypothetical protein
MGFNHGADNVSGWQITAKSGDTGRGSDGLEGNLPTHVRRDDDHDHYHPPSDVELGVSLQLLFLSDYSPGHHSRSTLSWNWITANHVSLDLSFSLKFVLGPYPRLPSSQSLFQLFSNCRGGPFSYERTSRHQI